MGITTDNELVGLGKERVREEAVGRWGVPQRAAAVPRGWGAVGRGARDAAQAE